MDLAIYIFFLYIKRGYTSCIPNSSWTT